MPAQLRSERGWSTALAAVWRPALASRILVWLVGMLAAQVRSKSPAIDPTHVTAGLGHVGSIVSAPAVRWDAVWYLQIATHGYGHASPNFFPLYPLNIGALALVARSHIVAGVLVSLAAFVVALCVLYRLVELDFGSQVASRAVWLVALFPMSLFFSAVYTESLFLALSLGAFYAARRRRWALAGLLGGLAAATRNVGVLLVVPLLVLYLQDRPSGRARLNVAWIALVPAGVLAYVIGLGIDRGTPFAMFDSGMSGRGFELPPVTVVKQIDWSSNTIHALTRAGRNDLIPLGSGIVELAFLVLALVAAVGVVRRLDRAYASYVIVTLTALLCEPVVQAVHGQPLMSFPRYILVLFPLWIWLALVLDNRRHMIAALGVSAVLLAGFTAQFATWRFVA